MLSFYSIFLVCIKQEFWNDWPVLCGEHHVIKIIEFCGKNRQHFTKCWIKRQKYFLKKFYNPNKFKWDHNWVLSSIIDELSFIS